MDPITIQKERAQYAQYNIPWQHPNPQSPPTETDPCSCAEENRTQAEKIGLDKDILTANKQTSKNEITNTIKVAFKEDIQRKGKAKSKVKLLLYGKTQVEPRKPTEIYEDPCTNRSKHHIESDNQYAGCQSQLQKPILRPTVQTMWKGKRNNKNTSC